MSAKLLLANGVSFEFIVIRIFIGNLIIVADRDIAEARTLLKLLGEARKVGVVVVGGEVVHIVLTINHLILKWIHNIDILHIYFRRLRPFFNLNLCRNIILFI